MAPKVKVTEEKRKMKTNKKMCGVTSPGPKYKLKGLIGHDDHCYSRLRNPAYSIAFKQTGGAITCGPGPNYMIKLSRLPGFSIGARWTTTGVKCTPGPFSYDILPCSPKFSIRSRTQPRSGGQTPGPYFIPVKTPGPSFSFGMRQPGIGRKPGPGPYPPYKIDIIKPRILDFSLGARQTSDLKCDGPGPKYLPLLLKTSPEFSFGVKHSECAPPLITECDEKC